MMHEQPSVPVKPYARVFKRLPLVAVFALAFIQIAAASAPGRSVRSVRAARMTPRSPGNGTTFAWVSRLNGSGPEISWDEAHDVAFLPDGRIAATGAIQMATGERAFLVEVYQHDGTLDWSQTIQGTAEGWDSEGLHIAVDALGNVVAVGIVHDTFLVVDSARPSTGQRRKAPVQAETFARPAILAISFTGTGTERWRTRLVSPFAGEIRPHAIALDSVNNLLIAGSSDNAETGPDFLVAKLLGSDGNIAWQRLIDGGGGYQDAALGVAFAPSANAGEQDDVVATGFLTDSDLISHFAVLKIDGDFGVANHWFSQVKLLNEPVNGGGTDVAVDAAGDVVAAGWIAPGQASEFAVAKFSGATGAQDWLYRHPVQASFSQDEASHVAIDSLNQVVTGGTLGTDSGGFDHLLVKLDNGTGSAVWTRQLVETGDQRMRDLALDPQDFIVSAMDTRIIESHKDFEVVRYSPDGTLTWRRVYAGTAGSEDLAQAVATDLRGNIAAAGFTEETGAGRDFTVALIDCQIPVLLDPFVDPTLLPSQGGDVLARVLATDNLGVSGVHAVLFHPDESETRVQLPEVSPGKFEGTLTLPANPDPQQRIYLVEFEATDINGNTNRLPGIQVTVDVADLDPPVIQSCLLDPTELPHTGGQVTLTAVVTDNVGVGTVTATITPEGGPPVDAPLTQGSGDIWSTNFSLAGNAAAAPVVYTVTIKAEDGAGNSVSEPCGTVTVAAPDVTLPVISNPEVTPGSLSPDGGTVTIRATVTDNVGVEQVVADVNANLPPPKGKKGKKGKRRNRPRPSAVVAQVPLTHVGDNVYEGQYTAPANDTSQPVNYTVTVRAQDPSQNEATAPGGGFTVAAFVPGRIQVTPATLNFGLVDLNDTVQREFTIRNVGKGFLTAEMTNLGEPFQILLKKENPTPLGDKERYFFGLAPGESLQVRVLFTPRRHARYPAEIRIFSSDAKKKTARVQIRAFGCELRRR